MTKVLLAICLLLAPASGQVCAAAAACAWDAGCHETVASHRLPNHHHAATCDLASCKPHGPRVLVLSDASTSRIEQTFSGKACSSALQSPLASVKVQADSIQNFMLLLPHPFPEALPPTYLANCTFLC